MKKLYTKMADAMKTGIEESFDADEMQDAGASFANGYDLQIAPYMPQKYILSKWNEDESAATCVGAFSTQQEIFAFIENHIEKQQETK